MLILCLIVLFIWDFFSEEYPHPGSEEKPSSYLDPVKNVLAIVWLKICAFFSYLKPSFLKKQWQSLTEKTWFELIYGSIKMLLKGTYLSIWSIYYVNKVVLKVILELMLGKYSLVEEEEEPMEKPPTLHYAPMVDVPRMALMSADDLVNDNERHTSVADIQQSDEGIVEDISE